MRNALDEIAGCDVIFVVIGTEVLRGNSRKAHFVVTGRVNPIENVLTGLPVTRVAMPATVELSVPAAQVTTGRFARQLIRDGVRQRERKMRFRSGKGIAVGAKCGCQ
jgi:hypothetical protein